MCDMFYRIIYMFHMPAFFALAGYIWKPDDIGVMHFVRKKFRRLMYPYVIFGFFSFVVYLVFQMFFSPPDVQGVYYVGMKGSPIWVSLVGLLHGSGWPNQQGLRMNSVLWFLPCMFCTIVMFCVTRPECIKRKWCWGVLLFVLSFVHLPECLPWGCAKIQYYIFYVFLGYELLPHVIDKLKEMKFISLMGLIMLYGTIISCFPRPEMVVDQIYWRLIFRCMSILGVFLSIAVAQKIRITVLVQLGVASLGIMLFHKFIVVALQWLPCVRHMIEKPNIFVSFLIMIIIAILAIGLSYLMTRLTQRFLPHALGM